MPESIFPEQIHIMAPAGFNEAIRERARREGRSASELVRDAIRERLRRADEQLVGVLRETRRAV